jgi:hypothetical protein
MVVVIRVYLDQNKWIDLARAATGHRSGDRFADALASARSAVTSGVASFPLDMYRYWETGKRNDDRSRNDVADVMLGLSRQHTMALPGELLPAELDEALMRRFGQPKHPRQPEVFGIGLRDITKGRMTWPAPDISKLPDQGGSISPDRVADLERAFNRVLEERLLRAGPDIVRAAGLDRAALDLDQQYVDYENSIGREIREQRLTGDLLELAVRASDLGGIRPAVTEALERIGLTWDEFVTDMGPGYLVSFMDDLPTRYVTNVMRSAKLRQTEQKWEPNDFNDVLALPVAAVYCDVVVTEKQWVHHMRQGKVDKKYATMLLNDTADLVGILASA